MLHISVISIIIFIDRQRQQFIVLNNAQQLKDIRNLKTNEMRYNLSQFTRSPKFLHIFNAFHLCSSHVHLCPQVVV